MKFTEALIVFCLLAVGAGFVALFVPVSSYDLFQRIFWLGMGVFGCWYNMKPRLSFLRRLFRFFKAMPGCWAASKEASK